MEIKIFFLVLSILFLLKNVVTFLINFYSEEPQPLSFNIFEKTGIYLTITYIITYILT
jgi:hypothetical protein